MYLPPYPRYGTKNLRNTVSSSRMVFNASVGFQEKEATQLSLKERVRVSPSGETYRCSRRNCSWEIQRCSSSHTTPFPFNRLRRIAAFRERQRLVRGFTDRSEPDTTSMASLAQAPFTCSQGAVTTRNCALLRSGCVPLWGFSSPLQC